MFVDCHDAVAVRFAPTGSMNYFMTDFKTDSRIDHVLVSDDFGVSFCQIFIGSYDKLELDLNLLIQNFGREPNFHPNGGVSDLRIIHKGHWIAFYPKKYQDSPQALRERIRKNEAIIKDREFQSHFKKGKFDTDNKVEF